MQATSEQTEKSSQTVAHKFVSVQLISAMEIGKSILLEALFAPQNFDDVVSIEKANEKKQTQRYLIAQVQLFADLCTGRNEPCAALVLHFQPLLNF